MDLLTVVGRRLRSTDELLRTHVAKNVNEEIEDQSCLKPALQKEGMDGPKNAVDFLPPKGK